MEKPGSAIAPDTAGTSPVVIFCDDYGNLTSALYLIEKNIAANSITLSVNGNHDLSLFFEAVNKVLFDNKIKILYEAAFQPKRARVKSFKKLLHILPDIVQEKRSLGTSYKQHFAGLKNCRIYFFSRGYSGKNFYLLNKLGKANRLFFAPLLPLDSPYNLSRYQPAGITDYLNLALARMIYGRGIALGKVPRENPLAKGFVFFPDDFMAKHQIQSIDAAQRNEMMQGFTLERFKIFDIQKYRAIYFDDGLIEANYPELHFDRAVFKQEIGRIYEVLKKYFPEQEIASKYHPGYNNDTSFLNFGTVLPSFIPAELLYNDNILVYLSIASNSIAHIGKNAGISIIDLISFPDDVIKERYKNQLLAASINEIYFPKTTGEFENMLANICKTHNYKK